MIYKCEKCNVMFKDYHEYDRHLEKHKFWEDNRVCPECHGYKEQQ